MGDWDPYADDDPQGGGESKADKVWEVPGSGTRIDAGDIGKAFEHLHAKLEVESPWSKINPKPDLSWHEPTCSLETWSHTDVTCELGSGIVYFTLNRPEDGNKLTAGVLAALADAVTLLHRRPDLRMAVFTGEGPLLCAGRDASGQGLSGLLPGGAEAEACERLGRRALAQGFFPDGRVDLPRLLQVRLWQALATVPQFTVCLANGSAMGEGLLFVTCCDTSVAVEGSFFSMADVHYGQVPAVVAPYLLGKVGIGVSKRLFCTCETVGAEKAQAESLVDELAPSLGEAHRLVRELCARLTACGPRSVEAAKELVMGVSGQQIVEPLMFYTSAMAQRALASEEARAASQAAAEGRPKPWEGTPIQPLR